MPAHITRLMTFAQHGEPKGYAASDMMRADVEALVLSAAHREPPTESLQEVRANLKEAVARGRDPHLTAAQCDSLVQLIDGTGAAGSASEQKPSDPQSACLRLHRRGTTRNRGRMKTESHTPQHPEFCCTAQFQGVGMRGQLLSDGADVEHKRDLEPVEARLVELMRHQWLGPQDALRLAGCFSLAQRVSELKREHGLPIVDEWRQVGRSRFKVYTLR